MKFFRKIRQISLKENRFSKYLVYALGEIVLVVIGILIALNINNRNQISKNQSLEQFYLKSLEEEFLFNQILLDSTINVGMSWFDSTAVLLESMGPQEPFLAKQRIDHLLLNSNYTILYRPNLGVLNEMIGSGKLSLIQNPELRFALSSYMGSLDRLSEQETAYKESVQQVVAFRRKHGNIRKTSPDILEMHNLTRSKFSSDNLGLLRSEEFENLLTAQYFIGRTLHSIIYERLKTEMENTIDLIKKEREK